MPDYDLRKSGRLRPNTPVQHGRQSGQTDAAAMPAPQPLLDQTVVQRAFDRPETLTPADVLVLQSTVGNRAVQRLLAGRRTRNAIANPSVIQTRLKVGAANDPYEREAERLAGQVYLAAKPNGRTGDAFRLGKGQVRGLGRIQRVMGAAGGPVDGEIENRLRTTQSGGNSLPKGVRRQLEPKLGADLSQVKIHTGPTAVQLNQALGAKAFTNKNHIYYGAGQSPRDLKLTAHEAVHTIQQGAVPAMQRQPQDEEGGQIQREIMPGADFLNATDANDRLLYAIAMMITMYHKAAAVAHPSLTQITQQFRLLRLLSRRIYRWFDRASGQHERLSGAPHLDVVKKLLQQTEEEHETLVDRYKDNAEVVPFELGDMNAGEAKKLWQSVVNSRGKIKLVGSEDYNRSVLSQLAQILDTPTGKELIAYLNTDTLSQPLSDEMSHIYIGDRAERLPTDVRSASPGIEDLGESAATGLGADHKDTEKLGGAKDLSGVELPGSVPTVNNPVDFRQAVVGRKNGITFNGRKHLFGKGTGSFVYVDHDEPSLLSGPGFHEVLGPRYITLAHELGHAAHMRAGATTGNMNQEDFMTGLSGLGAGSKDSWDNSEEFMTISNWENPIRQESGLTTARTGHRPAHILHAQEQLRTNGAAQLLQQQRATQVHQRFLNLIGRDPLVTEDKMVLKLPNMEEKQKLYFHVDEFYNPFNLYLQKLENEFTLPKIQEYKQRILLFKFRELKTVWEKAKSKRKKPHATEFARIANEVRTQLAHHSSAGQYNSFRKLRSDIDKLYQHVA